MWRNLANLSGRLPVVAAVLVGLCLSQAIHAERQPPLAFDEEITALSGAVVSINLRHFDLLPEVASQGFSITDSPEGLAFLRRQRRSAELCVRW